MLVICLLIECSASPHHSLIINNVYVGQSGLIHYSVASKGPHSVTYQSVTRGRKDWRKIYQNPIKLKPFKPTVSPNAVTHPPTSHYTKIPTTTMEHMISTSSPSVQSQTVKTTATQAPASIKNTENAEERTQPEKLVIQQTTPAPSVMIIPNPHLTTKPKKNTTHSIPDVHSTNLASIYLYPTIILQNTTIATIGKDETVNKCFLGPSIFPPLRLYTYIWPPYKVYQYFF